MTQNQDVTARESLIRAYLAGELSDSEAADFEAQYFADDELADEITQALEIKAATEANAAGEAPVNRSRWLAFATAACVALLAVGTVLIVTPRDPPSTVRGERTQLELSIARRGDSIELGWPAVDGADIYRVQVFRKNGEAVLERETQENGLTVSMASDDDELYARAQALGPLRNVIRESKLVQLPARP